MANRLIIVFLVLVALTQKSFCTHYFLSSGNDKSTEVPDSSNYGQSQEQEQNPAITEPQSSGYGQNNAGDQGNEPEGQSPGDSPHTEPTSPSGSSDGQGGGKDQVGSGGEDSTHPKDDNIHFPDDDSDEHDRWKLIYQYLHPSTYGNGYDDEQDQTDASGKKSINYQDDNTEDQDLKDATSPSGSSYSQDGGKDQAGSEDENNTGDQDDEKNEQNSNAEGQESGGADHTEPASPSDSGYGHDSGKDQAASGGEDSTNDQDDDKNDKGDNTEGQKTENTLHPFPVYPPTSSYGYESKEDQTDSEGSDSAKDQDKEKNDQDDNAEEQDLESPDNTESTMPSGSSYGYDGEEDQASSVGENSTNDEDVDTDDQGENSEGQKIEDSLHPFPVYPPTSSYGYESKEDQTDSEGNDSAKDQDKEKNDQDDNAEEQDLESPDNTESTMPSGSSYGYDGEEDQASSVGENSTNDEDVDTDDQGENSEGQKIEDSSYLYPVYPPSSGYGSDSELDQTDLGGEDSAIDLDDEKNNHDDNAEEQDLESPDNTESTLPSGSSYGYDGEEDQAGYVGEDSTNDQDDDKNNQDDNAEDQENVYDEGNAISQSNGHLYQVYHRYLSDSNYGHDSEQDQTGTGDEDNIQDQDNNAEGQDQEGSSYTSDSNPGQSYSEKQDQTAATGKDGLEEDNIANEQPYQSTEDQDGDEDSTEQGVDIAVSEQQGGSVTKFGADSVLLIGERDNMIILNWDGKNVTIGFSSIELAIAMLNNVTLEHQKSAKSSNVLFHQMASLLKNSDSKGSHHIIPPPLN